MASFAYRRARYVERLVLGHEPLDEHGAVFAKAIIKQVAEHLLPCAHLNKSEYAALAFSVRLKVGVNGLPEAQI